MKIEHPQLAGTATPSSRLRLAKQAFGRMASRSISWLPCLPLAALSILALTSQQSEAKVLISGYVANPAGTDSPYEYVQLIATTATDFSTTPYTVIWCNNGTATAGGWTTGGGITYSFSLTSGSVTAGQVFYVGGSGKLINGVGSTDISSQTWIKSINTGTTAGDTGGSVTAGSFNSSGVMGNGGANADGVAVFNAGISSITNITVPEDAVFFGTSVGTALVSGGTAGYQLPVNDIYSGGKLQSSSTLFLDPASGAFTKLTGTYDTGSESWSAARSAASVALTTSSAVSVIATGITITGGAPNVTINNTGTPPAANVTVGSTDVAVFGFSLTPTASVDFTALNLATSGTATTSDLSNFRVVLDADNSGTFSGGDTVVSGSGVALANPISFTITGETGIAAARRYLVIADVAVAAVGGHTFTGSIAAADVTTTGNESGFAAGNLQTISVGADDLTLTAVASSEAATISSLVNDATIPTTSQGAQVWQVTVDNPAGGAGSATISAATFTQGSSNGVANWSTAIQAAELFDGTTALAAGTVSSGSIAFTGLSLALPNSSSKTLSLRISLKSGAGVLTDNAKFQFALTNTNLIAAGNSVTTTAVSSDDTKNQIDVVATKFALTSVPVNVNIAQDFSATVQAQDANGNLDLDSSASVSIAKATGSGTLTGGAAQSLASGVVAFASLQIDAAGIFTIEATGSLTTATSGNITAFGLPTTLTAGDIAFTAFQSDNTGGSFAGDAFEFVLLVPVTAGTTLYFTDNGYRTDSNAFRTNENCVRWVAQADLPAGTVKQFINAGGTGFPSTAEWTGISPISGATVSTAQIALANGGDNIAAIQNPTFGGTDALTGTAIAQITFGGATFSATFTAASGNATTALAPGLTDAVNALSLAAIDNGRYDSTAPGSVETGTKTQVGTSINTEAFWLTSNTPFTPGGSDTTFTINSSSPYTTWAGGLGFDALNSEGVPNGLAWILGAASPGTSSISFLPTPTQNSGALTLQFKRVNPVGPAHLYLQYSNDLGATDPWHSVDITTAASGTVGDLTITVTPGSPDDVTVTIPVTKAAGGRLFGRLRATEN